MVEARKTNYASIAGMLCIVSGATAILGGFILATIGMAASFLPIALADDVPIVAPVIVMFIFGPLALMLFGLGAVAIAGGFAGTRRTRWGMLVLGAAASVVCFVLLGIPALVLAIMSEREFASAVTVPTTVRTAP